jgi:hypothetical protein
MQKNTFTIFTGDDKTINLKAVYEENGDPLDLTDCTEIDIALPLSSGLFEHLKLSEDQVTIASPAILGKFSAPIESDISALMNIGEFQNLDVTFTIASKEFTVRFFQALTVFERD